MSSRLAMGSIYLAELISPSQWLAAAVKVTRYTGVKRGQQFAWWKRRFGRLFKMAWYIANCNNITMWRQFLDSIKICLLIIKFHSARFTTPKGLCICINTCRVCGAHTMRYNGFCCEKWLACIILWGNSHQKSIIIIMLGIKCSK